MSDVTTSIISNSFSLSYIPENWQQLKQLPSFSQLIAYTVPKVEDLIKEHFIILPFNVSKLKTFYQKKLSSPENYKSLTLVIALRKHITTY